MFLFYDPTLILLIPAIILAIWAQSLVKRALVLLDSRGYLVQQEVGQARTVLRAAALTYVASTAVAVLHLLRLLILRGARD